MIFDVLDYRKNAGFLQNYAQIFAYIIFLLYLCGVKDA